MARALANQIGKVVEVSFETRDCRGRYLRVKVQIDIGKSLKKELKIRVERFKELTIVLLRYEKLHEFCFVCGKIGHTSRECLDESARKEFMGGAEAKYGSWLRANNDRVGGNKYVVNREGVKLDETSASRRSYSEQGSENEVGGIAQEGVKGVDRSPLLNANKKSLEEKNGPKIEVGQKAPTLTEEVVGILVRERNSSTISNVGGLGADFPMNKEIHKEDNNRSEGEKSGVKKSGRKWKKAAREAVVLGKGTSPMRLLRAAQNLRPKGNRGTSMSLIGTISGREMG